MLIVTGNMAATVAGAHPKFGRHPLLTPGLPIQVKGFQLIMTLSHRLEVPFEPIPPWPLVMSLSLSDLPPCPLRSGTRCLEKLGGSERHKRRIAVRVMTAQQSPSVFRRVKIAIFLLSQATVPLLYWLQLTGYFGILGR